MDNDTLRTAMDRAEEGIRQTVAATARPRITTVPVRVEGDAVHVRQIRAQVLQAYGEHALHERSKWLMNEQDIERLDRAWAAVLGT